MIPKCKRCLLYHLEFFCDDGGHWSGKKKYPFWKKLKRRTYHFLWYKIRNPVRDTFIKLKKYGGNHDGKKAN